MKKLIVVLLLLALCLSNHALAEKNTNFSELTDEETILMIKKWCHELALRELKEQMIIYQDEEQEIVIALNNISCNGHYIFFEGTIVNGSNKTVKIQGDIEDNHYSYVNNFPCYTSGWEIAEPGRNNQGRFFDIRLDQNYEVEKDKIVLVEGRYLITIDDQKINIPFAYTDFDF